MANQESKQPVYKDHLTAWRPDYPPVWNIRGKYRAFDYAIKPSSKSTVDNNIIAFATARNAIAKCIGQC